MGDWLRGRINGIAVMAIGGVWLALATMAMRSADVRDRWTESTGVVVDARGKYSTRVDDETGERTQMYRPSITYSYSVAGRSYQSDRLHAVRWRTSSKDAVRDIIKAYPVGSTPAIWVNPADPSEAVLRPDPPWFLHVFVWIGRLIVLVGVLGFLGVIRIRSRSGRGYRERERGW